MTKLVACWVFEEDSQSDELRKNGFSQGFQFPGLCSFTKLSILPIAFMSFSEQETFECCWLETKEHSLASEISHDHETRILGCKVDRLLERSRQDVGSVPWLCCYAVEKSRPSEKWRTSAHFRQGPAFRGAPVGRILACNVASLYSRPAARIHIG